MKDEFVRLEMEMRSALALAWVAFVVRYNAWWKQLPPRLKDCRLFFFLSLFHPFPTSRREEGGEGGAGEAVMASESAPGGEAEPRNPDGLEHGGPAGQCPHLPNPPHPPSLPPSLPPSSGDQPPAGVRGGFRRNNSSLAAGRAPSHDR